MVGSAMQKVDFRELTCQYPHILSPVPNRKSRLRANFYQPLVASRNLSKYLHVTCQNATTSAKLFRFSPYSFTTFIDKFSLVSSHYVVALQLLDSSDRTIWTKFWKYFYVFVPGAQSNKDNKTLQVQT